MSGREGAEEPALGTAGEQEARDTAAMLERVLPHELRPLFDALFLPTTPNPCGVKAALKLVGFDCGGHLSQPLGVATVRV